MTTLRLEEFAEWIVSCGGVTLSPTNEWEVLRYKTTDNKTGVIYRNKRGEQSFTPQSGGDYKRFLAETGLAKTKRVDRLKADKNAKLKAMLRERDGGKTCCYCGQFMDKPTLEHFHAIAKHGTNHPDNCALACEPCNIAAGNLPIIEKIHLRDRIREAVAAVPPWARFDASTHIHGVAQ